MNAISETKICKLLARYIERSEAHVKRLWANGAVFAPVDSDPCYGNETAQLFQFISEDHLWYAYKFLLFPEATYCPGRW